MGGSFDVIMWAWEVNDQAEGFFSGDWQSQIHIIEFVYVICICERDWKENS